MNHNLKSIYKHCIEKGYIKNVEYKTFSLVINEFNKEISNKILNGYTFEPNKELGSFHIVKDIRRGKTVDWGASNKLKQRIIDSGKIPFDKEKAPNGEEWLLYYEDNNYFKWKWFKRKPSFIKNIQHVFFKPSTKNRRTIKKVITDNILLAESYGTYK